MASNATAASAAAYELVWGDGVVGTWLLGMTVAFLTLMPLSHALFPKSLKKEGAFLLCFELVAAVPLAYCGFVGADAWLYRLDDFTDSAQRLYGTSPHAVRILQCNFSFQAWDFFISFFHKELRSPEMLAHHSLAAMLCYWALTMPYMHYYAVYFMGVVEISSVPLVLVDICKYYPELQRRFPALDLGAKVAFGLLFLALRDVFWVLTAVYVWRDGIGILRAGDFPPGYPGWVTASVLICNTFFSALQLWWTKRLFEGIVDVLGGGEKKVEDKKIK
eukprot:CAMPEP_0197581964 /NCGR_PEP_ID=MMETSP1326-20131121/5320_1 /TAXON_ID=1155430 /ORGANISM="Genus nov. species nov., Strain RCC2288" /LENGTH=275 /DNA_ID=CAMNT_0043145955 /DNA_START=89 /DNA_END=916 /DNA_ORIENTATION=-